jgi:hypothetical protein
MSHLTLRITPRGGHDTSVIHNFLFAALLQLAHPHLYINLSFKVPLNAQTGERTQPPYFYIRAS